ncbi:sulfatase [Candidatus Sumerlaeota bacterium]
MNKKPNVVFVFGDQWRQQATGYAGDPNVRTPNLDALAKESVNFTHALSGCPVCSPYRASLLTGQRPLTHGVFVNDVYLQPPATSIAEAFSAAGYDTAYIGKWHVDGQGRSSHIPPERRLGFDYWKALECTHDYNKSPYYEGDSDEKHEWQGCDAIAQTRDAEAYIRSHDRDKPFMLMLSWGPPHAPYDTAPEEYGDLYSPDTIKLRPNVPDDLAPQAREWLAGYYAHCSALDACMGDLLSALEECGLADNTILVFTSDHGDMLGSQGHEKKQRPWEESIRVPFLLRYPSLAGWQPRETEALIDAPDIMPTLLGLCGIPIPGSVEGLDFSMHIAGGDDPSNGAALLICAHPFGQWTVKWHGGKEYRGLRTKRYTYVRDREGPWLLYDNDADPYQLRNLADDPEFSALRDELAEALQHKLDEQLDEFLPGMDYISKWGYAIDENGTVPYTN